MHVRTACRLGIVCTLLAGTAAAQQDDVTFFVIGKHANFDQELTGTPSPVDLIPEGR